MILLTVSKSAITEQTLLLPLINVLVNFSCMALMIIYLRSKNMDNDTKGSMIVSSMVTNNVFVFPFILAVYGSDGFAYAVLFDFGNAFLSTTFTLGLATYYGGKHNSVLSILKKLSESVILWSIVIAIALNLASIEIPRAATSFLSPLGQMTGPLVLIVLGMHFSPKLSELKLILPTLIIRMGFGFLIGFGLGLMFGLEGTTLAVASLCSGAPIGFMALAYSGMFKLNIQLTTTAVSISIFIGMIEIPILMYLFQVWS